jgi:mRNA interferase MazF
MAFAPGDVVVVAFPYTDALAEKRRPAVVVSAAQLEKEHSIVWLAMVTSTTDRWPADVRVTDLAAAGLATACFVRPAKIATASVARIVRKAGALRRADWDAVRAGLTGYVGSSSGPARRARARKAGGMQRH